MATPNALNLDANFKPIQESIDRLIAALDRLEKKLDDVVKKAPKISDIFDSKGLNELVASIKKLDAASAVGFSAIIRSLAGLAAVLKEFPDNFRAEGVQNAIGALLDFFLSVEKTDFRLSQDQIKSISALARILKAFQQLSTVKIEAFTIPQESIDSIRLLVDTLSGIPSNSQKQVGFLDSILSSLQGLFQSNIGNVGNQNLEIVSTSLLAFSRAIKNLNKEIGQVDVKQILTVFTSLSGALQLISFVLSKLPGGDQVAEFSKTFQRLGIGLSGIARGAEALDLGTIINLVKSLTILAGGIKAIAAVVRLGGDKNAEAFSRIISSVVSALGDLNKIASVKNQRQLALDIGEQIKLIAQIVKSFSSLKGAKIPDIGGAIKAIAEAFSLLGQQVNVDPKIVANFEKFVDRIVRSIVKLNAINIDTRKAAAIGQQVEALSKLNNVERQLKELNTTLTFAAFLNALPLIVNGINSIASAISRLDDVVIDTVKRIGREFNDVGNNLTDIGQRVLQTFSLKTLTDSGAFEIATEFDALSKQLEVFGDLTEEQLISAQAFADEIGIKYPLSANDALSATLDLIKAGQDLNQVYSILPAAADLAALSDTGDVEASTRTLIAAASAFTEFREGITGDFDNIAVASDILAAAADVSTASIEDLSAGFADVGPIANIAGLNYEETAAALALLNDGQLRASEGGRGLRAALDAIFTRDKAKEEFAALGIAIFDAAGNIRNFDDILKDLRARFAGFSEKQIVNSLGNIADTFGRTSLSILIANDGISSTVDAMSELGTASDRARELLDTFRGDLEQLRGSTETALKNVFLPLIERAFRPFVQLLRQLVDGFLALPKEIQETASTLLFILATTTSLIGSLSILSGSLLKVSGLFLTLGGNLLSVIANFQATLLYVGALASSLAVVVPAIVALGGGLLFISEQVNTAFRLVQENVGGAGDAFENLRSTVDQTFGEIVRIIKTFAQAVQFGFDAVFGRSDEERGEGLAATFNDISESINGFLATLRTIDTAEIVRVFLVIKSQVTGFINEVDAVISAVSRNVGSFINPIRDAIGELLPEIGRFVNNVIALFTGIGAETKDIPIVETLTGIIEFIRNFLTNQIRDITRLLDFLSTSVLEPLAKNIPVIIDSIEKFISTVLFIFQPIVDFVFGQGKIVVDFFRQLPEILTNLPNAGSVVQRFAEDFVRGLLRLPQQVGATLERLGLEIGSSLIFFLGKGLTTGNFDAFINTIGAALSQFFRSIPDFFIRIGKETGNIFLSNFGLSLINGDADSIISSFFQLVENAIVTGLGQLLNFITDLGGQILTALFPPNLAQETATGLLDQVFAVFDFLGAPLRAAVAALAAGLDLASIALEIATSLAENIANQILSVLPNLFLIIAESIENETLRAFVTGFGNALKSIVDSLTSLLALPLKTIGSAFAAFSTFLDLLEKIGITRGASLLAITTLTLALTGLGDAILQFARKITLQVIQPTIIALQAFIFQIRSLAAPLIAQAKAAVLSLLLGIKNALSSAFIASVRGGTSVIAGGFSNIGATLRSLASISFTTIVSGIRSIGVAIRGVVSALAPLVLVTAAMTALQAAFQAFSDSVEDGSSFILNFFENISVSVLNLLGFDELVPQVEENFRLLEIILNDFFNRIGDGLRVIFLNVLQGFSDLRARIEQASADLGLTLNSRFAEQFFQVGDTLNQAGQLSGKEFFNGLGEALASPADLNALKTQLIPFKQTIIDEFKSLDFKDVVANDFSLGVDIVRSLINAEAIPDAFREVQGDLEQVLALQSTLQAVDGQAFSDNFAAFFEAALNSGIVESINQLGKTNYRDQIIAAFEQGSLNQEQAQRFLNALGFTDDALLLVAGELGVRFNVLSTSLTDLFATAQQSNLDDLRQQLEDGKISADEYQAALNELGEEIVNTVDAIRQDKIAALTKQFDDGVISEQEYRRQLELINDEADNTTLTALNDEIARITESAQNGSISFADAAKQIAVIQQEINNVKAVSPELSKRLEKLTADFATGKIRAREYADEFARITAEIEAAQKAANGEVAVTSSPTTGAGDAPAVVAPPVEGQEELNELLKEEIALKEKIADFNRDEARKLEDDLREEQSKRDDIAKIQADAAEKERDAQIDYNIERQRAEQDHQNRLLEIARSANDQFDDAIASRDSSAAQSAEEQLKEQTKAENDQFKLNERRAAEDFALDQQRAQRERDQRIAEANVALQDLIDKNARERARRLEDYNLEIAELNAKIEAERLTAQAANIAEEAAERQHQTNLATIFLNGVRQIQNAVAGGLPGVASLFTSFFTQMVNGINQSLAVQNANAAFQARLNGQAPPNRAEGGSVLAGNLYEVEDRNDKGPELLRQGNRSYLIPGSNGMVEPIKPLNQRAMAGAGSSMNIIVDVGGININGASGNFEQLAATIEKQIIDNTVNALRKQLSSNRRV